MPDPIPTSGVVPTEPDDPLMQGETPGVPSEPPKTSETPPAAPAKATVGDALDAFAELTGKEIPETAEPTEPQETPEPPEPEPSPAEATGRDYSGLAEDEIPVFKRMAASSFAFLKPRYLEAKKLKEENDKLKADFEEASKASFYDNPDAYQVTPEFRHYTANITHLDNEISHWKKQIANIRAGEKWIPIVLDSKGNPALGEPLDPDPAGEAEIFDALQRAHTLRQDLVNKAENLKTTFTGAHRSFISKMTDIEKEIFKGTDEKKLETAMKAKLSLFPSHQHGRPEIRTIAKLLAVIDGFSVLLREKESKAITTQAKSRTAANGGPRAGKIQTGGVKSNTVGAVLDEFNAYKARAGY